MSNNFPLFKKWYTISNWILETIEKYPKSARFIFSDRIANLTLDTLELITEAVYQKNKSEVLNKISINLEKIRVLMRMSMDKRYISEKQYEFISREINEAGKMTGGWIKTENIKKNSAHE